MSRPGDCWRCGIDPIDWWMLVDDRVWCARCHSIALALAAVIMNFPQGIATCLRAVTDEGTANDVERVLLAVPTGEILPPRRRW